MSEIPMLLGVLAQVGLVENDDTWLRITKNGVKVATQDHQVGGRILGKMLIQAGLFAGQIRRLLEVSQIDDTGSLACPRDRALRVAPQLTGILRRFKTVTFAEELRVEASLVSEMGGVWSLLPAPAAPEVDLKKEMGNRGELYSYQYCRMHAADGSKVRWVARDDETLGYDIEDLNYTPKRRIEVKSSGDEKVRFFLSRNEWNVANELGEDYDIHFWGGVSLKIPAQQEFEKLTNLGYPIIFRGLRDLLVSGSLSITPTQYLVTRSDVS
ncbi:DUF3883 domain-containing protein [Streptomyces sp. NPDC006700]|uniref:DUF3883 domain-containing protein n=1 Tax=Streptomyces sp. NPDC006700 TaxID=3154479 RepID=UPI0033C59D69